MRIRHQAGSGHEKIELQMTPMIDIVFLLLIFFIMSFKIVSLEGDFNIKMPIAAPSEALPIEPLPPIRIQLTAGGDGRIAGIRMGERSFESFDALHEEIIAIVGTDTGPDSIAGRTEVELDCDYDLHYEHAIQAVTAVSGDVDPAGHVVKLIDKIKFAPPEQ
jgi:biopolymer transport protein ExbD